MQTSKSRFFFTKVFLDNSNIKQGLALGEEVERYSGIVDRGTNHVAKECYGYGMFPIKTSNHTGSNSFNCFNSNVMYDNILSG